MKIAVAASNIARPAPSDQELSRCRQTGSGMLCQPPCTLRLEEIPIGGECLLVLVQVALQGASCRFTVTKRSTLVRAKNDARQFGNQIRRERLPGRNAIKG